MTLKIKSKVLERIMKTVNMVNFGFLLLLVFGLTQVNIDESMADVNQIHDPSAKLGRGFAYDEGTKLFKKALNYDFLTVHLSENSAGKIGITAQASTEKN